MKMMWLRPPLALILATFPALGAIGSWGQVIYKSGIDLVSFGVTVVDRQGHFVSDLVGEDFDVLEDGQPQQVAYFSRGDEEKPSAPLHLGLLFDTSGSMEEDLSFSRTAAIKFLNTVTQAVDITFVGFDTEVRAARFSQADFAQLVERIRRRPAKGSTALYDALGVYLEAASELQGRKVLVLYTDGGENSSAQTWDDTLTLLRASDATVYSIGFMQHQPAFSRLDQQRRLRQIAEMTGGQAFFPSVMKDLDAAYEKVASEVRAQYSLGYVSTNSKRDGKWRKVDIRIKRPGLKNLSIRSRKGYFAPFTQS